MNISEVKSKLRELWEILYKNNNIDLLDKFIEEINLIKSSPEFKATDNNWHKEAIVYSLYVDLFNKDFTGLKAKLPYLRNLGVNCLWLLPILDSPMRDAGFDIRNYKSIRRDLITDNINLSEEEVLKIFKEFLDEAHKNNIRVIFDIALNHTSEEHPWFINSRSSENSYYRDFYIWNKDTNKYKETRLLFKGMCPSNWQKDGDWFYFHRFFEFQPDLNYKNPLVLIEMTRNLLFWIKMGVDGFRADAIPYLWKEDGTNCENLEQTHIIVKFLRCALEYVKPDIFLLAEACQPPAEVVKYFGNEDECHAGYNFPLMPQIFIALATQKAKPIIDVLNPQITPAIPDSCQWFIFLRLHDELTLEMVTPNERDIINNYYKRDKRWDFRVGEGISARLADLMEYNPQKIGLIYSIMLTLKGTPIVYYGDEFGKTNDEAYFNKMIKITGKEDTRFFVRGPIDWLYFQEEINKSDSFNKKVFNIIQKQLNTRKQFRCFANGELEWIELKNVKGEKCDNVLAYKRSYKDENIIIINNLSDTAIKIKKTQLLKNLTTKNLLNNSINLDDNYFILEPYAFLWIVTGIDL
ncbi:MAG: alpha-glucosidase C-terminal domain-containing protein [Bacteroidales bacterium]|nr:alpha-glucosidase C-terminal domain-containing protein [Bacteroidales bacterium]